MCRIMFIDFFYRYLFLLYLGRVILKFKNKVERLGLWISSYSLVLGYFRDIYFVDLMPYLTNQWKGYHWLIIFILLFVFFSCW